MEPADNKKIILTEDGSSTIYNSELNQHYHSIHGAIQESQHVFMKMGFEEIIKSKSEISILEIGFGTGLNAFLVLLESLKVVYTSLEAFPLEEKEFTLLNYAEQLNVPEKQSDFLKLHSSPWEIPISINENFTINKKKVKLEDFIFDNNSFDLIFFDAFSPEVQPELWTEEIFRKIFSATKPKGILVTYCAKGQVRRNMIAAGFSVERLEGPPGKREMLRGRK
ncbi:tRNA (5-methylaminomethyl-2-thiouridine)(34)-methyltransferase MnmD [soil metagenome]